MPETETRTEPRSTRILFLTTDSEIPSNVSPVVAARATGADAWDSQEEIEWKEATPETVYSALVRLYPEEADWCAHVPRLPGVATFGATLEEALANVREALRGALAEYKDQGSPIPWLESIPEAESPAEIERWITVRV